MGYSSSCLPSPRLPTSLGYSSFIYSFIQQICIGPQLWARHMQVLGVWMEQKQPFASYRVIPPSVEIQTEMMAKHARGSVEEQGHQ